MTIEVVAAIIALIMSPGINIREDKKALYNLKSNIILIHNIPKIYSITIPPNMIYIKAQPVFNLFQLLSNNKPIIYAEMGKQSIKPPAGPIITPIPPRPPAMIGSPVNMITINKIEAKAPLLAPKMLPASIGPKD